MGDGLWSQDRHLNANTERYLLGKKESRGGPIARLSANFQAVSFSKPLPELEVAHLEELVTQSSGEVMFGEEEGDEEVLEKEDPDIREYWVTGTQEGHLQEDDEGVCVLAGGQQQQETRVCWSCHQAGHIKSSCPLRRWNHLGVAFL